jgi:glycosyltransferase involved in cell wall biosynthesis
MKKITIFPRYNTMGASSRYRFYLYADRLRASGYDITISSFLDNNYLKRLYTRQRINPLMILKSYLRRFIKVIFSAKFILLEYELFPYLPYWVSRMFLFNKRYILNYDDNVWMKYASNPMLVKKFDRLIKNADCIIAANEFLFKKIGALNPNVVKIPTVVDLDLYQINFPKFERFTVVWIGTPMTYKYLQQITTALRKMSVAVKFELLVVAGNNLRELAIDGVNMRFVEWSPESEVEYLIRSHVGIMPLADDDFSKGKSAFKIIQYFAAGLPVIASPVGENCNIVQHGENGFLVNDTQEWVNALIKLNSSTETYNKTATAARASSFKYSIQYYYPTFLEVIKKNFS